jgi:hypothetical protein
LIFFGRRPIIIPRNKFCPSSKKEDVWHISKVVDLVQGLGRCIRLSAVNAKKNAKYLLNPEKTVRYTVKNVILNVKTKAVN